MPDEEQTPPVGVGDGRRKHVTVVTSDGEEIEHSSVYLRHTDDAFIVSPEWEFSDAVATRYEKTAVARLDVVQHHSSCFITTAVAGDGPTLGALRTFRDEVLSENPMGRVLVTVYYRTSPPVAETLAAHPTATSTRAVRLLVNWCATLERRRQTVTRPSSARLLAVALTLLYAVGMLVAVGAHLLLTVTQPSSHPNTRSRLPRSE